MSDGLVIADNGRSSCSIVIPCSPSPAVRFAAHEVQAFLREMTGAVLPVVSPRGASGPGIFLGPADARRGLEPEEFAVRSTDDGLVLEGSGERGVLFAAYAFLEELGCRWFTPRCSFVPDRNRVAVRGLDRREKPAFVYRETNYYEAQDGLWRARNRLNGTMHGSSSISEMQGPPRPAPAPASGPLVPRDDPDHPEYYALVDGERKRTQFCMTNPGLLRRVTDGALRWMDEQPDADIFSICQWDSWDYCRCPDCSALIEREGTAGPLIHFINRIARAVAAVHPDKRLLTLAYQFSDTPPSTMKVEPNVIVQLCHMGYCSAHAIDGCEKNAPYLEKLHRWREICDCLYIWHYITDFAHYLLPFPNFTPLAGDLRAYRDAGADGVFCQGNKTPGGEMAELRSYLVARLLWNPHLDARAVMEEFVSFYYGEAAGHIMDYITLLEQSVAREQCHFHLYSGYQLAPEISEEHMPHYLTPEVVREAVALLEEALRKVTDPTVAARVEKAKLAVDYAELMTFGGFAILDADFKLRKAHPGADTAMLRRFLARAERHGVRHIREGFPLASFAEEIVFPPSDS